jgi:two-component system chemotaxis response regulator CheB
MPVVDAHAGDAVAPGRVYIARPDLHLVITPQREFAYHDGSRIRLLYSSANPLLESASGALGGRVIAVVLSGTGSDATDGVQAVKASGGRVIVQDEASAEYWDMPRAAVQSGAVDLVLPLEEIAPALIAIVRDEHQ